MAKKPGIARQPWTAADLKTLKRRLRENAPAGRIAEELGRSEASIYGKAALEGLRRGAARRTRRK